MDARQQVPLKEGPPGPTSRRDRTQDHHAWQELVRRFAPYVHAVATANALPEADAELAFDEVFLRLWSRLGELADDDAIRSYVVTQADRVVAVRRRALPEPPPAAGRDAAHALREALAVSEAARRLTALQREILERRFAHDEDEAAIAVALGVPEETVTTQLARARRRLRARLRITPPGAPDS
jgi:RNA polymerase sigma factor (sigma-70 family)